METGQWLLSTASHLAYDTWLEASDFPKCHPDVLGVKADSSHGSVRSMTIKTRIDAKFILDTLPKKIRS